MNKVEIFADEDIFVLENTINKWTEKVDEKPISTSICYDGVNYIALIVVEVDE